MAPVRSVAIPRASVLSPALYWKSSTVDQLWANVVHPRNAAATARSPTLAPQSGVARLERASVRGRRVERGALDRVSAPRHINVFVLFISFILVFFVVCYFSFY